MQTKHLLCLDPHLNSGRCLRREASLSPPVNILLTVPRRYFLCGLIVLFMSCVCHAFASVHCCRVVTCWEKAELLGLVFDVYLCFCHFLMWNPGSGVVLDCIDS